MDMESIISNELPTCFPVAGDIGRVYVCVCVCVRVHAAGLLSGTERLQSVVQISLQSAWEEPGELRADLHKHTSVCELNKEETEELRLGDSFLWSWS